MAANLGMLFYCTQRAARIMARQRHGSIINISSIGAVRAHRQTIAYDAMKGAMDAFTRAVAVDVAPWGVRVNSMTWGHRCLSGLPSARGTVTTHKRHPHGACRAPGGCGLGSDLPRSDDAAYVTGQSFQVHGGLLAAARSPKNEGPPSSGLTP